jgi:hypothetical protein
VNVLLLSALPAFAGDSLPDRLAGRATATDVVLSPPIGEPSPKAGSFLIPYKGDDPARAGLYEVGPSSCSEMLRFKSVPASESREEMWLVESGVGASVGLPQFGVAIGGAGKSIAGIEYKLVDKLVVDGGLAELEECCLRSPEQCTDRYVSEVWRGAGSLSRTTGTNAAIKTSLKYLDKLGKIDFGTTKGWTMASTWGDDMYFAYRTAAFRPPSCESYMKGLGEVEGKLLFVGVSRRVLSEQEARRDAQDDARQQVVKYLGEQFKIEGDIVTSKAEALVAGIKDGLTCTDAVQDTPEGPAYLARVRMYVDKAAVEAALSEMQSTTGKKKGGR